MQNLNGNLLPWLLDTENPSVRYWTLVDVLNRYEDDPEVQEVRAAITHQPLVKELFALQHPKGYWGDDETKPYTAQGAVAALTLLHMLGVPPDNMARHQAKLAVDSRAFPLFIYDPRKGNSIKERLSLQGNPAADEDWYTIKKTGEVIDFITFARSEGRFAKQFDRDGNPSETLQAAQADRLANWHLLQEMAGIR